MKNTRYRKLSSNATATRGITGLLWVAALVLAGGCAVGRGGRVETSSTEPGVALPDDELCRIRPMKSEKRYVSLITGECATSADSVGLKSSESKQTLATMGAHE